jgi:hypothetical protein
LKPWEKKIDAVLQMQPPINLNQLGDFVGMVNYHGDMRPHRYHLLTPLTAKTGAPTKGVQAPPFKWTSYMQLAFEQTNTLMAADVYVHILITINH